MLAYCDIHNGNKEKQCEKKKSNKNMFVSMHVWVMHKKHKQTIETQAHTSLILIVVEKLNAKKTRNKKEAKRKT